MCWRRKRRGCAAAQPALSESPAGSTNPSCAKGRKLNGRERVREKVVLVMRLEEELDGGNADPLIVWSGLSLHPPMHPGCTQLLFHRITKQLRVKFMPVNPSSGTQSEIFPCHILSSNVLQLLCTELLLSTKSFQCSEILWHHDLTLQAQEP
jgi:hypothetical protein